MIISIRRREQEKVFYILSFISKGFISFISKLMLKECDLALQVEKITCSLG